MPHPMEFQKQTNFLYEGGVLAHFYQKITCECLFIKSHNYLLISMAAIHYYDFLDQIREF